LGAKGVLVVCIVVVGVCLRFTALDKKVYWYDETFTSLEVSGYTTQEVSADVLTGRPVSVVDLEKYQRPAPSKSAGDTVRNLIANEPQLTPAYFVLLRWWSELAPDSIAWTRALSAVFSVAVLALAFWLCRELFPGSRVAQVCVVLIAVSPFHLLYAQEARPYSMWCVTVLLSSVVLLRAMRKQTAFSWALYALCAALSLYTFLLSVLVIVGHACFVAIEERFRITRTAVAFLASTGAAVIAFLPWPYRGQHSGAGNEHLALLRYAVKWARSIGILFADFNLRDYTPKALLIPYLLLVIGLIALCGYSIYFVYRNATRRQSAFVLSLICSVALPLSLLDLLTGSSLSLVTRYIFPTLLGLQIAVAYVLNAGVSGDRVAVGGKGTWCWTGGILCGIGLLSCLAIVRADRWWNKDPDNYIPATSRIINAADRPLVVSDAWFVFVLTLEHRLHPDVHYQLSKQPGTPKLYEGSGTVFVFRPSTELRAELEKEPLSMLLVDSQAPLWKLTGHAGAADEAPVTRP
jgi:uncharacterized membrane protein